ncbi:MAG: hypothetical protein E6J26_06500 [Chloroflexi bacterium]|nr:MAG: hypothetical protein E6J26_06500 [Chloroflexota bacterium]
MQHVLAGWLSFPERALHPTTVAPVTRLASFFILFWLLEPWLFTYASAQVTLGMLAYVDQGDLWVKALPDGEAQSITSGGAVHSPRWSASGEWIAYLQGTTQQQLHVVRSTGADDWVVHHDAVEAFAWSPVTDVLAFAPDQHSLWQVNPEGSPWRLVLSTATMAELAVVAVTPFSCSADGTRFAYVLEKPDATPRYTGLWEARSDGSGMTEAYNTAETPDGLLFAGWSSDQRQLFFWSEPFMQS